MGARYDFRQWGEGDDFSDIDADELLRLAMDEYLETGDLNEAIDRLLTEGFTTESGEKIEGLRKLLEETRRKRRELEQAGNPDGEMQKYRDWLREIEELEKTDLIELQREADESGDERRAEVTRDLVSQKTMQQDLMPEGLGERLRSFQNYDFVSSEAREQYEQLISELREDVLNTYFEANKEFFANPNPEELARMRSMMDALSTMIEQDRRGEDLDPTFDSFMENYGDYFPGAETLEDVVRAMAERAAAAEAMFNSLSPDQQRELRGMFDQMMSDMDLNFSMSRLVDNLRLATPDIDWQGQPRLRGDEPASFADARRAAEQLAELGDLEDFLGKMNPAQGLPEIDVEAVRRNLGPDAATQVEKLQRAVKGLSDNGLVDREGRRLELTAKGVRQIGQAALKDLFKKLKGSATFGSHRENSIARGGDREESSKAWEPGQPFSLHLPQTLRNAVFRNGPGTPVKLAVDDFVVEEYEATKKSATVFAIDLSKSMAMRGNLMSAKKMTLALTQLIRSRYPRDFVAVVGFGLLAHEIRLEDVPALTIDYTYGTNLQHALALSRHLMRSESGDRQIVVVTDGEPTSHLTASGEPFFRYPPVIETLQATMAEVLRCTKAGITINTFALDIERTQFPFVEQIARVNGGRAFYTSVDDLGSYVLDDFVQHRQRR